MRTATLEEEITLNNFLSYIGNDVPPPRINFIERLPDDGGKPILRVSVRFPEFLHSQSDADHLLRLASVYSIDAPFEIVTTEDVLQEGGELINMPSLPLSSEARLAPKYRRNFDERFYALVSSKRFIALYAFALGFGVGIFFVLLVQFSGRH